MKKFTVELSEKSLSIIVDGLFSAMVQAGPKAVVQTAKVYEELEAFVEVPLDTSKEETDDNG